MANEEQLAILRRGTKAWNAWRGTRPVEQAELSKPNLSRANLYGANLYGANLSSADLSGADLHGSNLYETNLCNADLRGADLRGAYLYDTELSSSDLSGANLYGANLSNANLSNANLFETNLTEANLTSTDLSGADFRKARFVYTIFGSTDLSTCKGLDDCMHGGPSVVDFDTLQRSGLLPLSFLRGIGLSDKLIEYLPSLINQPVQLYSCFISYSAKDYDFVERLHADLQNKSVRCWFAPHDMPIGAKIFDAIDEAIRLRDKVLLVLSEASIASDWVEGEVTRALDEERQRKQIVLLPIRIDNAVMETTEAWARLLRGQRNIGDFTPWKEHDAYGQALSRLLNALRTQRT